MYADKHLLAICLNTKIELILSVYQISRFFPLDQMQSVKTLFLNRNISYTWHDMWLNTWPNRALSIYNEHPSELKVVVIS